MPLNPAIHQAVAGAAVESAAVPLGPQQADIADAAHVEHHPICLIPSKHRSVEGRHQRRPLPTGSHVPAPEIVDHADAGQFGQQRCIQQLQGETGAVELPGAVADRLSMRTQRADLARRQSLRQQHLLNRLRIDP